MPRYQNPDFRLLDNTKSTNTAGRLRWPPIISKVAHSVSVHKKPHYIHAKITKTSIHESLCHVARNTLEHTVGAAWLGIKTVRKTSIMTLV